LLLDETVDYTSNGSAITLTSGAAAGDEIEVVAYNTFSVGDAINQAAADTRYVNATGDSMTGNLTTTGNVGVGETSPNLGSSGTGLHIKGAASKEGIIKLDSQTANYSGRVQFTENGTDKWRIGYDATSNHLEFTRSGVADRMLISDDGYVTKPNQPSFLARGNFGGWQTVSSGNGQTVLFGNAVFNVGSHFATNTSRFTAPIAGKYLFHFHCYMRLTTVDDDTNYATTMIYKNGSNYENYHNILGYYNLGDSDQIAALTAIIDLSATDYVDARVYANSGDMQFYQPNANFTGYLLG